MAKTKINYNDPKNLYDLLERGGRAWTEVHGEIGIDPFVEHHILISKNSVSINALSTRLLLEAYGSDLKTEEPRSRIEVETTIIWYGSDVVPGHHVKHVMFRCAPADKSYVEAKLKELGEYRG